MIFKDKCNVKNHCVQTLKLFTFYITKNKQQMSAKKVATKKAVETPATPSPAKKVVKKAEAAPEPVPEPETPETPSEDTEVVSIEARIKEAMATIDTQMKDLKSFKGLLKTLLVDYQKEVRENKNKFKKRRSSSKSQVPHGFTKPVHISSELSSFLNVDKDTTIARPSVTKAISQYVKEHSLYEESNKSIFKADDTLKKLLGEPMYLVEPKKPELGLGYGYKNLQKYLSPHFLKA